MSRIGLRRAGLAAAVASGLGLMATAVQGIAGVDNKLEVAAKQRPVAHQASARHECPFRHRQHRLRSDRLSY
jgi:hypothetical protein